MELPPGLNYLLQSIPASVIPTTAVYSGLTLLARYQYISDIPLWSIIPLAILTRLILFILTFNYKKWMDSRTAKSLGAIIPPVVQEWSLSLVAAFAETSKNGYPGDLMNELCETYGQVLQLELFGMQVVSTSDPDHVKAILSTQFDSFEKGPIFIGQMSSLLGSGVFNADGEMWKFHRSMTRPFFTRERISDFEIYERNCDISLRTARNRLDEGFSLDFQDLVSRFTLDSASEFLFGNNVGSLSAGIPYTPSDIAKTLPSFYNHPSTGFVKAFSEAQVHSIRRISFGKEWPLYEFLGNKIKPLRSILDQFTEPLLKRALDAHAKERSGEIKSNGEDDVSLLAHLVRHTQDPTVLKDELINLLVAGRDTTGSLLTFSFYMLTQYPEIERRLRKEIFDKVGPTSSPNYEHMREMKFMRAFLNEVLRLYPPVPGDSRCTNKAVVLPATSSGQQPIYISANTTIVYNTMNMHRRTDLWGPDALEFDPDRFLDGRLQKYLVPNPFIFTPFNAGPRICLGQQFAYHEATFFLVRLLQQYTGFTLDDSINAKLPKSWATSTANRKGIEKAHPLAHLTMYIKDGLWVRMQPLESTV